MESRLLAGRYRLNALLGRGGMAVVWRAVDEQLDREVAVKAVELTGPDSEGAAERFRKEARTTARLNHPNIVTVFDSGVDGQTAYIVMELLSGPTLAAELLEHGPMQFDEVRRIGQQVCAGLAAAHDAGVIHRDIKPGNIAYAGDDAVKVLDFGITQLVDEAMGGHSLTAPQTVLGTAEYLSPEQASARPVDARADLYAFGCVLAALLTGQPPFLGDTSTSVLLQHTQAPLPDFSARRPGLPQGFIDLLHDLLAKDRFDRPATARDVQKRLAGMSLFPPGEEIPVLLGQLPSSSSAHDSLARVDDPPVGTGASALDPPAPTVPPASSGPPEPGEPAASPHVDEPARSDEAARLDEADTLDEAAPSEDWDEQGAHDEWEELRRRIPPPETRSARTGQLAGLRSAVVLWILAAAAVLLLVILWRAGHDRSAGASGSSSSLSSGPSATAPAGPSASRTTATSSSLQALGALRLAVTQARAAREVDARAALVLHRRLDEIALALKGGGDDEAASKQVDQLAKTINQLADQGHVTYAGQQRLAGPFADLQRQVPPRSN